MEIEQRILGAVRRKPGQLSLPSNPQRVGRGLAGLGRGKLNVVTLEGLIRAEK